MTNLFTEVEGQRKENLASSALRYLLAESGELRSAFLGLLSSMFGPIGSSTHFASECEFSTSSPNNAANSDGRLDLLVETDEALIGIEAKIWAQFQDGQPEKYIPSLIAHAALLKKVRRSSSYPVFLIVLGPESRRAEIEQTLQHKGSDGAFGQLALPCQFLSWSSLLATLEKAAAPQSYIAFLTRELRLYVAKMEGALANFPALAPHLARWEPHGSRWHRDVLGGLWHLIPGSGKRLGVSESWCGYGISTRDGGLAGWFGFLPRSEFEDSTGLNEAELVIWLQNSIGALDSSNSVKNKRKLVRHRWSEQFDAYPVKYELDWDTTKWREFLAPLCDVLLDEG
ncbi:PD-(D/E)XK nuclease family protein [Lentisalinibacter orientalis]|uniref:PD-(D/E)XK nuclease family protein n=1 Tax=Lentisalinibacter orientalis TaxID=2992241 RepID=UPI0038652999